MRLVFPRICRGRFPVVCGCLRYRSCVFFCFYRPSSCLHQQETKLGTSTANKEAHTSRTRVRAVARRVHAQRWASRIVSAQSVQKRLRMFFFALLPEREDVRSLSACTHTHTRKREESGNEDKKKRGAFTSSQKKTARRSRWTACLPETPCCARSATGAQRSRCRRRGHAGVDDGDGVEALLDEGSCAWILSPGWKEEEEKPCVRDAVLGCPVCVCRAEECGHDAVRQS